MPTSVPSSAEIKDEILRRARARQIGIERGEYDVPLRYAPLPLDELLDYLGQWEYRRDSLALAVPPPRPGPGARLGRFCKNLVCKSLRWLLIRQVEFNTAALSHARVLAGLLESVDKNQAEFLAAFNNLKLQVDALTERVARLERAQSPFGQCDDLLAQAPEDRQDEAAYPIYLKSIAEPAKGSAGNDRVLVLGSGQGDLLRFLVAEGIMAHGIDADPELVDYCRERELPVSQADFAGYLQALQSDSLAGIMLTRRATARPVGGLSELLGLCWTRLQKGGVLIAEMENPHCSDGSHAAISSLSAERLHFLLESRCFRLIDTVFVAPLFPDTAPVGQLSSERPFDLKQYRHYAVIGCK